MNLKCPKCAGQVMFEPKSGKVICRFCDWETTEENFSQLEGRREYDRENAKQETAYNRELKKEPELIPEAEEYMETNIYHCSSCGAELMLTGTEASTFCSYCGSPTIVFDRVSKEVRPKWIIPFKLTQEQALNAIKEQFRQGDYIPSKIRALTVEKVHGIYMPYWLFTTDIRRRMEVEVKSDDGIFRYMRDASCQYKNVTFDASRRLNNEMSRRLEPFHTEDMVEFDVAYLSGFYADRYDVTKEATKTANLQRCREFLDDAILDSCPHANKMGIGSLLNYKKKDVWEKYEIEKAEYALLPAYFVNIKYDTGRELVIVNGQTGKVVANLPYEKEQIVKKFVKNSLIACPIFMLISYGILFSHTYPVFLILLTITGVMIGRGIWDYKKYKLGKSRLAASSMKSYTNDREESR